jgi:ABC-type protease/lipase transport system fused ATPase/permease subunit
MRSLFWRQNGQGDDGFVEAVAEENLALVDGDEVGVCGEDGGPGAPQARHLLGRKRPVSGAVRLP